MQVHELIDKILMSRQITRYNQQELMLAFMIKNDLGAEDRHLINTIFNDVGQGLVKVVD